MKIPIKPILPFTFAGCLATASLFAVTGSHAQTATPTATASPSGTPTPTDHTAKGQFRDSSGNSGTFVETFTVADDVTTDTVVYTLSSDSTQTSTETLTTTTNTDGTKTVVYSDLGFGATAAFTSTTTYAASTKGVAAGTGTFTAADGTTGTLIALSIHNGPTSITNTDFTSAAGAVTREVRLEEKGGGGDSVKTVDVDAAGTVTVTTVTRFGGMHHQHP